MTTKPRKPLIVPNKFEPNKIVLELSRIRGYFLNNRRLKKDDIEWLLKQMTGLIGTDEFAYPMFMLATKARGNQMFVQHKKLYGGVNISDGNIAQALIDTALTLIKNESFAAGMQAALNPPNPKK